MFFALAAYFFSPATATAPAGSDKTLVSSKISFTPAQTSSMETVMTSSTHSFITSRLCFPTCATATPSANIPMLFNLTLFPACIAAARQAESSTSTPNIFVFLFFCEIHAEIPASSPPPPTGTKIASKSIPESRISLPTVPWPAIVYGSSKGSIKVLFSFLHSFFA